MNNIIESIMTGLNPFIVIAIGLLVSVLALFIFKKEKQYGDTKERTSFEQLKGVRRKYFW